MATRIDVTETELNTIINVNSSMRKINRKFVGLQRQIKRTKNALLEIKEELGYEMPANKEEALNEERAELKVMERNYKEVLEYVRAVYTAKLKMELEKIAA